jgi:phosphoglycerate kinase
MTTPPAILHVDDLELTGQRVLVRLDLEPGSGGFDASWAARIAPSLATVIQLVDLGAKVMVAGHQLPVTEGAPVPSLEEAGAHLAELTGLEIILPDACVGDVVRKLTGDLRPRQFCLLENLASNPGELTADEAFARELMELTDAYISEAPIAIGRKLASTVELPRLVPKRGAGAGLLAELDALQRLLTARPRTTSAVLEARSLDEFESLAQRLIGRVSWLAVTGPVAFTLLAAKNHALGATIVDSTLLPRARTVMERLDRGGIELMLPMDLSVRAPGQSRRDVSPTAVPEAAVVDAVGAETLHRIAQRLRQAETALIWGEPLAVVAPGRKSEPPLPSSLEEVLAAVCGTTAFGVILGQAAEVALGDEALVPRLGHVARGGATAMALLTGAKIPGIEVLRTAATSNKPRAEVSRD